MIPLVNLICLSSLAAAARAQEVQDQPPRVSVAELTVGQYEPQNVSIEALANLVEEMAGRRYYVAERGGYESEPVTNIDHLGGNLVVYDTKEYVARVLELCTTLDRVRSIRAAEAAGSLTTFEYRPSFITLDAAHAALSSFQRAVRTAEDMLVQNVAVVPERGLLVIRETPANLAEMRSLFQRIDVPREQILITCYLLSTGEQRAADPSLTLPADLVKHLQELLPAFELAPTGFSMVRSSVAPDAALRIEIWSSTGAVYRLELAPSAFDPASGSLTVERCVLDVGSPNGPRNEVFSTSAVFRGGEYTVLGATGARPVFLVVRVSNVR